MLVQLGHKIAPQPAQLGFLPTTLAEAQQRGWDQLDVVIVTGDAYVDHPAFGPVLIARFLEQRGLRVGILAQPDWRSACDFRRLGRPRLFFGVSAGNLDSMLNRLTAQKRTRSEDPYSPGGRTGARPDRATLVYAHRCREAFPEVPIVLGGVEASLRRIAHYDYWSDSVRRPVLIDAKAELLVFGSGEWPIWEVSQRLQAGEPLSRIRDVPGTAYVLPAAEADALLAETAPPVLLPSYEEVSGRDPASLRRYAEMARLFHLQTAPLTARPLLQRVGNRAVYFNPPASPLPGVARSAYRIPFTGRPHPSYAEPIPAFAALTAAPAPNPYGLRCGATGAPSFIAGYPGSTLPETIELALFLKRNGLRPRNVQDFIPTPMSLAATMYYTGLDPLADSDMQPVSVPRSLREKKLHRALLLYWERSHHDLAREALHKAGRPDLIGQGPDCLVP